MDDLEQLTGVTNKLMHDGIEYEVSPLGLKEIAELRKWAKAYVIAEAKESLAAFGGDAPEDVKNQLWQNAVEQCKRPLESDAVNSPEGLQEFVLLSLRIKHPAITRQQVTEILTPENLAAFSRGLKQLGAGEAAKN